MNMAMSKENGKEKEPEEEEATAAEREEEQTLDHMQRHSLKNNTQETSVLRAPWQGGLNPSFPYSTTKQAHVHTNIALMSSTYHQKTIKHQTMTHNNTDLFVILFLNFILQIYIYLYHTAISLFLKN
jgi:hypothetical protein